MATPAWRELFPFESRTLQVPSGRLHYVDEGPRTADPILCLHGNPTWAFHYRRLIAEARPFHRVVAFDHMGMGLSDRPVDFSYTLADHVKNAIAFVDALDLKKITLVVHDWGGAIGMGMALARPERIARVTVMNTAAFFIPHLPKRIAICRAGALGEFITRGLNGFARAATTMTTSIPLPADVKAGYLAPYASWRRRIGIWNFVRDIPMEPDHRSRATLAKIDESLASLGRPVQILWGERDWCFTPQFREEWQKRFPKAYVHKFEDASHYLIEDEPNGVIARIRDFAS
ncbi:MAG TPA: alpha/beta fold hydrolase [Vicinamibacteria bacterium]|nr:alpha/beta fold hydrolase [Vicinamibacteria bacterium]